MRDLKLIEVKPEELTKEIITSGKIYARVKDQELSRVNKNTTIDVKALKDTVFYTIDDGEKDECEYCERGSLNKSIIKVEDERINKEEAYAEIINGDKLKIETYSPNGTCVTAVKKINVCPICGRKL